MRQEEPGEETEQHLAEAPPADMWPWDASWWKAGDDIRCLVKAGALIAAELDRRIANGEVQS